MSRTRWIRQIAVAVAAVALAAATLVSAIGCGGSDQPAAGTGAATGASATGTPIKVSVIGLVNTPVVSWPGIFAGAKAAALAINQSGGIGLDHHPVEVVTCDYELDANKANVCARDAVSAGVVADIGSADIFTPATTPIFRSAGIPRLPTPLNPADSTMLGEYPLVSGGNGLLLGTGPVLADLGIHKVAWVEPSPNVPTNVELFKKGLSGAGVSLVGRVPLPGGVSDYAPYAKQVQDLVDQGAEAVVSNVSLPFFQLVKTFKQLGGDTKWVQLSQVDGAQIKAAGSVAEGMFSIGYLPPASADIPAVQRWVKEMAAVGKTGEKGASQLNAEGFNAWLGVYALKQLLADTKGPITGKTVDGLIQNGRHIDVQGFIDWSPAEKGPAGFTQLTNGDVWLKKVVDGEEVLAKRDPVDVFKSLGLG